MEFRYRAGENPASAPPRHPLPPPMVVPKHSLEALQRELEEEKIKEEIIATRLNQRRMIEEEIRREIRLQPQPLMVLPPPPSRFLPLPMFPPPPPPLFCQEPLEFDESSSANLQNSDVTDTEFANRKRKATNVDVNDRAKFLRAPQAQKDWSCALCMVSATSEDGLKEHLKGKKHRAKTAELVAGKKAKATDGNAAKKKDDAEKTMVRLEINGESYSVVDRGSQFFCEMCDVKCDKEVMISHLSGKRHAQQEAKKKKKKQQN